MLDVETFSFLPKGQGDGRDLARQFGFHPLGYPSGTGIFERSGTREGRGGGVFEEPFEDMVAIGIQAAASCARFVQPGQATRANNRTSVKEYPIDRFWA
jgi:hypothetical protein